MSYNTNTLPPECENPCALDGAETPIAYSYSSNPARERWEARASTWGEYVEMLDTGAERAAVVMGGLVGGKRYKTAVAELGAVALTVTGVPVADLQEALTAAGWRAAYYPAADHRRTETLLERGKVETWLKGQPHHTGVNESAVLDYLGEANGWTWEVSEAVVVVNVAEPGPAGLRIRIAHDPLPSYVVVLPLADPFNPCAVAKMQSDGIRLWGAVVREVASRLGVGRAFDKGALDPAAYVHLPTARETVLTVEGEPLDWCGLDVDTPETATRDLAALTESLSPDSSTADVDKAIAAALDTHEGERERVKALDAIFAKVGGGKRAFDTIVKRVKGERSREVAVSAAGGEKINEAKAKALTTRFPPPARLPKPRYMGNGGRTWLYQDKGDDRGPVQLWTPWAVVGGVVDVDDDNRQGVRIAAEDQDGQEVTFTVTAGEAFVGGGLPFKTRLREHGIGLTETGEFEAVRTIREHVPPNPIRRYARPGWRGEGLFITPWGTASTDEPVELAITPDGAETVGTLDGWKAATAAAWRAGVLHFKIAPLVAFGSVLTDLCEADSTWIGLTSSTSKGKTTAAELMASVWGDPAPRRGLYGPLNGTGGAAEARMAAGSGAGGAFDETALVEGSALQTLIFTGSGGATRDRLNRAAELRNGRTWRGMYIVTGEHDLARKIKSSGSSTTTGVGTRILELDCEDAPNLDPGTMKAIKAALDHHGHAGMVFVKAVIAEGLHLDPDGLWREIEAHAATLAGDGATPPLFRAARIAATLWRAGEIAKAAGLLPADADVEATVRAVWAKALESELAPDKAENNAVNALFGYLLRNRGGRVADGLGEGHGEAVAWRLTPPWTGKDAPASSDKWPWGAATAVYAVPRDQLSAMTGGALNARTVVAALNDAGALIAPAGDRLTWQHVPGVGRVTCVVIDAAKVEGADGGEVERKAA